MSGKPVLLAAALCVAAMPAAARSEPPPSPALIDNAMLNEMRRVVAAPVVWKSILSQNAANAGMSEADIERLDAEWVAEHGTDDQPLIASVVSNPISSYLTRVQAGYGGLFVEIIVMDDKGLNVGQSAITSDYWQGDEPKFQRTFPLGAHGFFVDEAEFHEPTATWRAQVSLTVVEPESREPIGAATFEVNLTELQRRRFAGASM